MGYAATMASELEFFLFTNSYAGLHAAGYRGLDPISPYNEDYHIFQTTKEEEVMRAVRTGLNAAGVPVECSKGEASAGQEEINVRYADALTAADTHVVVKNAVKEIAWAKGKAVTFMAKYDRHAAGSSAHIHQSLRTADGKPAFFDPGAPHGMSRLMRSYLAGLLAHAGEITYFLAPCLNSYKRFAAGTFAPTRAIWSIDNRTAGYRLVGEGSPSVRIECRVGGADLNPYLAFATQIAAGIAGIEQGLELEPEFRGDAYTEAGLREIPKTLRDATTALDGSRILREALGDEVVDHYVRAARWEQAEYDKAVTDWESCAASSGPEDGKRWPRSPAFSAYRRQRLRRRVRSRPPKSVLARLAAGAREAQRAWRARPLAERAALVLEGIARLERVNADLVFELARQMGRPVRYEGEIGGVQERADYMARIAEASLAPMVVEDSPRFRAIWRASRSGSCW